MSTSNLFKSKTVLSFEVFPAKRTVPEEGIYNTLDKLEKLKPDFISVTYGAGGSGNGKEALEIVTEIKRRYGIESAAHLPCIGLTRDDVAQRLIRLKEAGVKNILALRGDISNESQKKGDFLYASDLIGFIREHGDFNIIAACYPEGHPEAENMITDIRYLKRKVDAGAGQLITQMFFDNEYFYRFREKTAVAGIQVPIEAGIMPVTNKKQIERLVSLCGVSLPKKFVTMMKRYESNPEAMRDAGIAYAVNQIVDLIAQGVDGIHLYTMNKPCIAEKIYEAISTLL